MYRQYIYQRDCSVKYLACLTILTCPGNRKAILTGNASTSCQQPTRNYHQPSSDLTVESCFVRTISAQIQCFCIKYNALKCN